MPEDFWGGNSAATDVSESGNVVVGWYGEATSLYTPARYGNEFWDYWNYDNTSRHLGNT